ncbi:OpgC family protein [Parasedimentitalea huanghaiensis]|uniref:OpgC domain-containing protein n=1 Tax=Parasedimentitalea huanghaiensis TaxID=2682100 RepID=A0A6L6WN84_9RHOB|nr:OpgC domain-containing protein [Zongyanglinia huanghaiensis]MVO17467.1 OpgC domain-containing protein [Zongyanglinia huanghaiensis]
MAPPLPQPDLQVTSLPSAAANQAAAPVQTPTRSRDPRLDFYRGIAMFIILTAHIPGNRWTGWIPARFGFSDATEIFVFCSGMASAIAFGGSYSRRGWLMGSARVGFRVWQVFWAHIGLFFLIAMMMAALDTYGGFEKNYVNSLNLGHFFKDTMPQLVGLFTLTYVPNYFDILPMYLVVLGLMPLLMAMEKISLWAVAATSIAIWLAANPYVIGLGPDGLSLPAEPWSDRKWFFNPFGWQLLFFTGFAFMKGWLPKPPVTKFLITAAICFVVFSAPFGAWKVFRWVEVWNQDLADTIRPVWSLTSEWRNKSDFGLLRFIHFLSLAYLGWVIAGDGGKRLIASGHSLGARIWAVLLKLITKVGQQSLAVFVFSMALARLIGFALDQTDRTITTTAIANLLGYGLIILVAFAAAWFKSQPWRAKR